MAISGLGVAVIISMSQCSQINMDTLECGKQWLDYESTHIMIVVSTKPAVLMCQSNEIEKDADQSPYDQESQTKQTENKNNSCQGN